MKKTYRTRGLLVPGSVEEITLRRRRRRRHKPRPRGGSTGGPLEAW